MFTLDNFRYNILSKICGRGEDYFYSGAVSELEETSPGEWTAVVNGSEDYNVELSLHGNEIVSWDCDCPYDGSICKHVVATLFAIQERMESAFYVAPPIVVEKQTDDELEKALSIKTHDELTRFIRIYAKEHMEFKHAFIENIFHNDSANKRTDYAKEVLSCFNMSGQSHNQRHNRSYSKYGPDWETVLDRIDSVLRKAELLLQRGELDGCSTIALQVLRSIGEEHISWEILYDIGQDFAIPCDEAAELIFRIIQHPQATPKLKNSILEELKQINVLPTFQEYEFFDTAQLLEDVSIQLLPPEKALETIDQIIKESGTSYYTSPYIIRKINLLREMNRHEEAKATILRYIDFQDIRNMEIERLIGENKLDEALLLIDNGIELAKKENNLKSANEWTKQKGDLLERMNRTEDMIECERQLFINTHGQLEYYRTLKKHVPTEQWKSFLEKLMKQTHFYDSRYNNTQATIYMEEGDNQRLFELLKNTDSSRMEMMNSYSRHLKATHSKELLEIYVSDISNYAEHNVGKSHYYLIAESLRNMKKLEHGETSVQELVARFRTRYKNRRAMMEILKEF